MLLLARDARASTLRVTIGVWGLTAGVLLLTQGTRMLRIRRSHRLSPHASEASVLRRNECYRWPIDPTSWLSRPSAALGRA